MADIAEARCTCPAVWLGTSRRPACVVHEEAEALPPGMARRRDGTMVEVARTIGVRRGRARDPEGMGADTWRRWP